MRVKTSLDFCNRNPAITGCNFDSSWDLWVHELYVFLDLFETLSHYYYRISAEVLLDFCFLLMINNKIEIDHTKNYRFYFS